MAFVASFCTGEGSKGGAVVRALASHQCGPGSTPGIDAIICGLSLLLVLSLAPRGFSPGTPVFPSPQKPTFPNSNSTRNQVDEEPLCGCVTYKSLFIFYLVILPTTVKHFGWAASFTQTRNVSEKSHIMNMTQHLVKAL